VTPIRRHKGEKGGQDSSAILQREGPYGAKRGGGKGKYPVTYWNLKKKSGKGREGGQKGDQPTWPNSKGIGKGQERGEPLQRKRSMPCSKATFWPKGGGLTRTFSLRSHLDKTTE